MAVPRPAAGLEEGAGRISRRMALRLMGLGTVGLLHGWSAEAPSLEAEIAEYATPRYSFNGLETFYDNLAWQRQVVASGAPLEFGPGYLYHGLEKDGIDLDQAIRAWRVTASHKPLGLANTSYVPPPRPTLEHLRRGGWALQQSAYRSWALARQRRFAATTKGIPRCYLTRAPHEYAADAIADPQAHAPAILMLETAVFNDLVRRGRAVLDYVGERAEGEIDPYPNIPEAFSLDLAKEIWVREEDGARYQRLANTPDATLTVEDLALKRGVVRLLQRGVLKAIPGLTRAQQLQSLDPFERDGLTTWRIGDYMRQRGLFERYPIFTRRGEPLPTTVPLTPMEAARQWMARVPRAWSPEQVAAPLMDRRQTGDTKIFPKYLGFRLGHVAALFRPLYPDFYLAWGETRDSPEALEARAKTLLQDRRLVELFVKERFRPERALWQRAVFVSDEVYHALRRFLDQPGGLDLLVQEQPGKPLALLLATWRTRPAALAFLTALTPDQIRGTVLEHGDPEAAFFWYSLTPVFHALRQRGRLAEEAGARLVAWARQFDAVMRAAAGEIPAAPPGSLDEWATSDPVAAGHLDGALIQRLADILDRTGLEEGHTKDDQGSGAAETGLARRLAGPFSAASDDGLPSREAVVNEIAEALTAEPARYAVFTAALDQLGPTADPQALAMVFGRLLLAWTDPAITRREDVARRLAALIMTLAPEEQVRRRAWLNANLHDFLNTITSVLVIVGHLQNDLPPDLSATPWLVDGQQALTAARNRRAQADAAGALHRGALLASELFGALRQITEAWSPASSASWSERSSRPDRTREDLDYLRWAIPWAAALTEVILDDLAGIPHPRAPLDLARLAQDMAERWRIVADWRGVQSMIVTVAPQPLWVVANPVDIRRAVDNLVANAAEALRRANRRSDGHIEILVASEGPWVALTVRDNGPGLPDAVRALINQPELVEQVPSAKPPETPGIHGIGLLSVKRRVEEWNGEFEARNRSKDEGGGTAITLRLLSKPDVSAAELSTWEDGLHDLRNAVAMLPSSMDIIHETLPQDPPVLPAVWEAIASHRAAVARADAKYLTALAEIDSSSLTEAQRGAWRAKAFAAGVQILNGWSGVVDRAGTWLGEVAQQPNLSDGTPAFVTTLQQQLPLARVLVEATTLSLQGASSLPVVEDLAALFAEYGPLWRAMATARGAATVEVMPPAPQLQVRVNRLDFMRVVLTLVDNAAKAVTGAGRGARGTVTIKADASDGGVAVGIHVSDNGSGVPAETLDALNAPVEVTRVPSTTAPDGHRHGRGLAKTKSTIAGWGGHLQAQSVLDQRTEITVWLPTAAAGLEETGWAATWGWDTTEPFVLTAVLEEVARAVPHDRLVQAAVARVRRQFTALPLEEQAFVQWWRPTQELCYALTYATFMRPHSGRPPVRWHAAMRTLLGECSRHLREAHDTLHNGRRVEGILVIGQPAVVRTSREFPESLRNAVQGRGLDEPPRPLAREAVEAVERAVALIREANPEAHGRLMTSVRLIELGRLRMLGHMAFGAASKQSLGWVQLEWPYSVDKDPYTTDLVAGLAGTLLHEADHVQWMAEFAPGALVNDIRFMFPRSRWSPLIGLFTLRTPYRYLQEVRGHLATARFHLWAVPGLTEPTARRKVVQGLHNAVKAIGKTVRVLETTLGKAILTPGGEKLVRQVRHELDDLSLRVRASATDAATGLEEAPAEGVVEPWLQRQRAAETLGVEA